jgi:hypothetical protein
MNCRFGHYQDPDIAFDVLIGYIASWLRGRCSRIAFVSRCFIKQMAAEIKDYADPHNHS